MSYKQTPKDQKAAIVLFHAMLGVASFAGLDVAGKQVVDALQARGYLQPKKIWGQTFEYNFIPRERKEVLEGEELAYRMSQLDIALDDAADHIDGIDDVLAVYASAAGLQ